MICCGRLAGSHREIFPTSVGTEGDREVKMDYEVPAALVGVELIDLSPAAQAALDEALADVDAGRTEVYDSIEAFDAALRAAVVGDLDDYSTA